jgi:hypothetical protein
MPERMYSEREVVNLVINYHAMKRVEFVLERSISERNELVESWPNFKVISDSVPASVSKENLGNFLKCNGTLSQEKSEMYKWEKYSLLEQRISVGEFVLGELKTKYSNLPESLRQEIESSGDVRL